LIERTQSYDAKKRNENIPPDSSKQNPVHKRMYLPTKNMAVTSVQVRVQVTGQKCTVSAATDQFNQINQ